MEQLTFATMGLIEKTMPSIFKVEKKCCNKLTCLIFSEKGAEHHTLAALLSRENPLEIAVPESPYVVGIYIS